MCVSGQGWPAFPLLPQKITDTILHTGKGYPMTKPCKKCGSTDRTPRDDCRACAKAYMKAWHEKNAAYSKAQRAAWGATHKEARAEYNKAYREANLATLTAKQKAKYDANPEKYHTMHAARYAANPEKENARVQAWMKAHPQKRKEYYHANPAPKLLSNQNRRARVAGGKLTPGLAERLLVSQRGLCACCGVPLAGKFHLDHIMPLALGGTNTDDNIQLLLPRCNIRKKDKHPEVYMSERTAARQSTGY
jgi:5-methylcytosine-specific restriction endonuclease McrA